MPTMKRHWTDYPGVYFIEGTRIGTEKPERIYYVKYRTPEGKVVEEKAGRAIRDRMTAAKAAAIRGERISGKALPNVERREAIRAKKAAAAGKWTFDRLWTEYNEQRRGGKPDPTDKSNYMNHISPLFGEKEPAVLVPLDVDRLRVKLQKTFTPGTVAKVLGLLRRLINFAAKKHLSPAPAFKVELPQVDNLKTEDLNPEQLTRLLTVLRGERLADDPHDADTTVDPDARDIMLLALCTGMRRGEIFKLTWDAVDFRRGFIAIRSPKGGKDQTIPLSGSARQVLEGRPRTDNPYVFPGRNIKKRKDGPLYHPRTEVKRALEKIRKRAKLPKGFRPLHGLRHHFASALASSGEVDLYTLQRLLTHKSPLMTQRYAHLRDDTLRRAAEIAGRIIEQAPEEKAEATNK